MNRTTGPTALLAEDEPLLRSELRAALARLWPELVVVAQACDGIEATSLIEQTAPDLAFLDVRMPGLSGIDVARLAANRVHVVFLTAFGDHAVDAFDHGAVDYLLKPLDMARLAICVQRLKAKLTQRPADLSGLGETRTAGQLRWIQASAGGQLRFVDVNEVRCFRADAKYTRVVTAGFEGHIRTTIKDLASMLDVQTFWQISRSAIVNVAAIDTVKRVDGGLALRIDGHTQWLPVSQAYQHRFRQM